MAKSSNTTGLRPLYSFDQLVIGPHNHVAAAACHEVVKKPGETYNPLFIYGPVGVGKTHLMQAIANEVYKNELANFRQATNRANLQLAALRSHNHLAMIDTAESVTTLN